MIGMDKATKGIGLQLSLAVSLKDGFTGGKPEGNIELTIDGHGRPVQNPSGYHNFLNLPSGSYQLKVISENYLDEAITVNIVDNQYTVKEISLTPRSSYHFSAGDTLVRGALKASWGPVADAVLKGSLSASSFSGRTDKRGEFVIFFGPLKDEEVMKEGITTYIKNPDPTGNKKEIPILCEYRSRDGKLQQAKAKLNDLAVGTTNFRDLVLTTPTRSPAKEAKVSDTGLKESAAKNRAIGSRAVDIFSPYELYDFQDFF